MSTRDFELSFFDELRRVVAESYPGFELRIPSSGSHSSKPTPDFVVTNPSTGAQLVGEVKGGWQATHIPLSTLPQLRALRESFSSNQSYVVFITTGLVPETVRRGLAEDDIEMLQVRSPSDAAEQLEGALTRLKQPTAV